MVNGVPFRAKSTTAALVVCGAVCGAAVGPAQAADPLRIAVISEAQAVAGSSIGPAAQLAADEINAKGGIDGRKIEIVVYDDHSSSAEAVRAFQRAVSEDKVNAVIASYISEVVLALEPWAARLKTRDDHARRRVRRDHPEHRQGLRPQQVHLPRLSHLERARRAWCATPPRTCWSTPLQDEDGGDRQRGRGLDDAARRRATRSCLPKVGLKVLDHIRFSPDTTDFTPIFNKIEGQKPDVIITGISHVGTQPTVQWKSQQVPMPMFGISSQATNSTFWKDTNGATEGVLFNAVSGPGVAVTPKTLPFVAAFEKKYGNVPSYSGYTAYDEVYMIADAIHRAGSTDSDKLVAAMEKTDYVGTIGRVAFLPKGDPHVHGLRTGSGYITGLMLQWQDGKQLNLWPKRPRRRER